MSVAKEKLLFYRDYNDPEEIYDHFSFLFTESGLVVREIGLEPKNTKPTIQSVISTAAI